MEKIGCYKNKHISFFIKTCIISLIIYIYIIINDNMYLKIKKFWIKQNKKAFNIIISQYVTKGMSYRKSSNNIGTVTLIILIPTKNV